MNLDWKEILETFMPLALLALLGGVGTAIRVYRKNIFIWFKRQKLRFFPVDFNVALSLDFKEGLNSGNYFGQIKKNLLQTIDDTDLRKHIKLEDFSDIQKFNNREEAESFRNKKNIDLIIWGGFTDDSLKREGEPISKINLSFTYGHPENREKTIGPMIQLDIRSRFAQKRYWEIVERNSLSDLEVITNDIFDISTYILALT